MTTTNAVKAHQITQAIKVLQASASAFRHGRPATGRTKLDQALDILENVHWHTKP